MMTPAFNSDRGLVSLILCRMANLSLEHGNNDASSLGLPEGLDFGRADSLGLQLVPDLTHQLHGTISLRRDAGTTFTITFDEDIGVSRA